MADAFGKAGAGVFGAGLTGLATGHRPDLSLSGLAAWLARQWAQEARERRFFLWLPVFFLAGVMAYFAAEREPDATTPVAVSLLLAVLAVWTRWRGGSRLPATLLAVAVLCAGFRRPS